MIRALHACGWLAAFCPAVFATGAALAQPADPTPAQAPVSIPMRPVPSPAAEAQAFARWRALFRVRALEAGISTATFDAVSDQLRYDAHPIQRDRAQPEFTLTPAEYLARAVSEARIRTGKAMLAQYGATLDAIERRYGVEKEILVAIWGLESNYGLFRGETPVITALASLAYDGRRAAFFESQLLAALRILDSGQAAPDHLLGSWAGAMGHTQFMPTTYLAHAVDFAGDGHSDIWSEDPVDALASAAAYLAQSGWRRGVPWGAEIALPTGFDFAQAGRHVQHSMGYWRAAGITAIPAVPDTLPTRGEGSILLLMGAQGPAFMVFENFAALMHYNSAESYALAVGHLSDRLQGKPAVVTPWPQQLRALRRHERWELQSLLAQQGFNVGKADGIIGPQTRAALRAYQRAHGLVADAYPSDALLEHLRRSGTARP